MNLHRSDIERSFHVDMCPDCGAVPFQHAMDAPWFCDHPRDRYVTVEVAPTDRCDRVMIGLGTDVFDPVCELPNGHRGPCKSTVAVDSSRLGAITAHLVLHFPDGTDADSVRMVMGDAAELVENHWNVAVSVALRGPEPNAERERLHSALEGTLGVLLGRQTSGERWRTAVENAKAALNG